MGAYKVLQLIFAGTMALGVIGSGLWMAVKFVSFLTEMRVNVRTVMTNHLPHIEAELRGLRSDFDSILKRLGGLE